jgi:nicotinamidase-related amidase
MAKTHPETIRDPRTDNLLTPENTVVALIDYQEAQFTTLGSISKERLLLNVRAVVEAARQWEVPVVISTVGVDLGANKSTVKQIMDYMPENTTQIDRTGVNAWEDEDFRNAILAAGRRNVVIGGLWTEVCVAFPTLDMLREGFKVYPVVDAIGGISRESHEAALRRMVNHGADPINAVSFAAEMMRNWARPGNRDKMRNLLGWYFPEKLKLDEQNK